MQRCDSRIGRYGQRRERTLPPASLGILPVVPDCSNRQRFAVGALDRMKFALGILLLKRIDWYHRAPLTIRVTKHLLLTDGLGPRVHRLIVRSRLGIVRD